MLAIMEQQEPGRRSTQARRKTPVFKETPESRQRRLSAPPDPSYLIVTPEEYENQVRFLDREEQEQTAMEYEALRRSLPGPSQNAEYSEWRRPPPVPQQTAEYSELRRSFQGSPANPGYSQLRRSFQGPPQYIDYPEQGPPIQGPPPPLPQYVNDPRRSFRSSGGYTDRTYGSAGMSIGPAKLRIPQFPDPIAQVVVEEDRDRDGGFQLVPTGPPGTVPGARIPDYAYANRSNRRSYDSAGAASGSYGSRWSSSTDPPRSRKQRWFFLWPKGNEKVEKKEEVRPVNRVPTVQLLNVHTKEAYCQGKQGKEYRDKTQQFIAITDVDKLPKTSIQALIDAKNLQQVNIDTLDIAPVCPPSRNPSPPPKASRSPSPPPKVSRTPSPPPKPRPSKVPSLPTTAARSDKLEKEASPSPLPTTTQTEKSQQKCALASGEFEIEIEIDMNGKICGQGKGVSEGSNKNCPFNIELNIPQNGEKVCARANNTCCDSANNICCRTTNVNVNASDTTTKWLPPPPPPQQQNERAAETQTMLTPEPSMQQNPGQSFSQQSPTTQSFMPQEPTSQPSSLQQYPTSQPSMQQDASQQSSMLQNRFQESSMLSNSSEQSTMLPSQSQKSSMLPNQSQESSMPPNSSQQSSTFPNQSQKSSMLPNQSQEFSVPSNQSTQCSMQNPSTSTAPQNSPCPMPPVPNPGIGNRMGMMNMIRCRMMPPGQQMNNCRPFRPCPFQPATRLMNCPLQPQMHMQQRPFGINPIPIHPCPHINCPPPINPGQTFCQRINCPTQPMQPGLRCMTVNGRPPFQPQVQGQGNVQLYQGPQPSSSAGPHTINLRPLRSPAPTRPPPAPQSRARFNPQSNQRPPAPQKGILNAFRNLVSNAPSTRRVPEPTRSRDAGTGPRVVTFHESSKPPVDPPQSQPPSFLDLLHLPPNKTTETNYHQQRPPTPPLIPAGTGPYEKNRYHQNQSGQAEWSKGPPPCANPFGSHEVNFVGFFVQPPQSSECRPQSPGPGYLPQQQQQQSSQPQQSIKSGASKMWNQQQQQGNVYNAMNSQAQSGQMYAGQSYNNNAVMISQPQINSMQMQQQQQPSGMYNAGTSQVTTAQNQMSTLQAVPVTYNNTPSPVLQQTQQCLPPTWIDEAVKCIANLSPAIQCMPNQTAVKSSNSRSVANSSYIQPVANSGFIQSTANTNTSYNQSAANPGYIQPIVNSSYNQPSANSGYSQSVANSNYNESIANSNYNQSATNSSYGQPVTNSGYNQSNANSDYSQSTANSSYSGARGSKSVGGGRKYRGVEIETPKTPPYVVLELTNLEGVNVAGTPAPGKNQREEEMKDMNKNKEDPKRETTPRMVSTTGLVRRTETGTQSSSEDSEENDGGRSNRKGRQDSGPSSGRDSEEYDGERNNRKGRQKVRPQEFVPSSSRESENDGERNNNRRMVKRQDFGPSPSSGRDRECSSSSCPHRQRQSGSSCPGCEDDEDDDDDSPDPEEDPRRLQHAFCDDPNLCPYCGIGVFVKKTTVTGYLTAILCFPCGLYCCLSKKICYIVECTHCHAVTSNDPLKPCKRKRRKRRPCRQKPRICCDDDCNNNCCSSDNR